MKPLLLILFVLIIGLNYGADVKGFGYFLEGGSMKKAKLEQLSKQGTTDLFFNFFGLKFGMYLELSHGYHKQMITI